jgi:hypothetical protein
LRSLVTPSELQVSRRGGLYQWKVSNLCRLANQSGLWLSRYEKSNDRSKSLSIMITIKVVTMVSTYAIRFVSIITLLHTSTSKKGIARKRDK